MRCPDPVVLDFEGPKIQPRPNYPADPVGVAIHWPGKRPTYRAWGHPEGNNCSRADAKRELVEVAKHPDGVLCHYGKFDLDALETCFGIQLPPPLFCHDSIFKLFLDDPHQLELGLKVQAERVLGLPPEERDELVEWLMANKPVINGEKLSRSPKSDNYAGAYVAHVPVKIAGPYALGDLSRTRGIFRKLWPKVVAAGMLKSYQREQRLQPIILDMERQGLRLDTTRLGDDVERYEAAFEDCTRYLAKRLGNDNINFNSPPQIVEALLKKGLADESKFLKTDGGDLSGSKDSLALAVKDKRLAAVFGYRSGLKTALGTYMRPWSEMATQTQGYIYANWNQTRNAERGGEARGVRTGRLSATWFMNIPKRYKPAFAEHAGAKYDGPPLPQVPPGANLLPLPDVRGYIVPYERDDVIGDRDYNQQEPHILAHFEDGALARQYRADPWIDFHDNAMKHLASAGLRYDRRIVKDINLGIIYGKGLGATAEDTGLAVVEAKRVRDAIYAMYPGLKERYTEMRRRAKAGEPLVTWGGRVYYCEKPVIKYGRIQELDYKMVNTEVQGSAADCTKEAVIRYYEIKPKHHRLLLQVHDQLVASFPKGERVEGMEMIRAAMESIEFNVPMPSEGEIATRNWAETKPYDVGPAKWAKMSAGERRGVILRSGW